MTNRRITTGQPSAKDLLEYSMGFDDLFNRLGQSADQNYPPSNLIVVGGNQFVLEMAVAGFSKQEITVETENNILIISGKKQVKDLDVGTDVQYRHRGLAFRDFTRRFAIADDLVVDKAHLENGLLTITIKRVIPNRLKKKVYDL